MLTISAILAWGFTIISFKYLPKNNLVCTILVVYLETDLSKKLKLNFGYIFIKILDLNNQNNILYKTFY